MRYEDSRFLNSKSRVVSSTISLENVMSSDAVRQRATEKRVGWATGVARSLLQKAARSAEYFNSVGFSRSGRKEFPVVVDNLWQTSHDARSFVADVGGVCAHGPTKVTAAINAASEKLSQLNLSDKGLEWTRLFPIASLPLLIPILGRRPKLSDVKSALEALNVAAPDLAYELDVGHVHIVRGARPSWQVPLTKRVDDPVLGEDSDTDMLDANSINFVPDTHLFFLGSGADKVQFASVSDACLRVTPFHPIFRQVVPADDFRSAHPGLPVDQWCTAHVLAEHKRVWDPVVSVAAPPSPRLSVSFVGYDALMIIRSLDHARSFDPAVVRALRSRGEPIAALKALQPDARAIVNRVSRVVERVCKYKVTVVGPSSRSQLRPHPLRDRRKVAVADVRGTPLGFRHVFPASLRSDPRLRGNMSQRVLTDRSLRLVPAEAGQSFTFYTDIRVAPARCVQVEVLSVPMVFPDITR
jgi:hypothetical protein